MTVAGLGRVVLAVAVALACCARAGIAESGCREALAQHAVCEAANELAIGVMRDAHLDSVSVMQEVSSGALVVFAASQASRLDVSTEVRPLSLAKVFLAASWWDRQQPDRFESAVSAKQAPVDIHEMLVGGSDSAGREVALALRKAVGTEAVMDDLKRYGFNRSSGEAFWAEVDPRWRQRLTPQPGEARIAALDDEDWSSALSIGESDLLTTALQVSRFFQAVGNGGLGCAASARRVTKGVGLSEKAECKAPIRIVQEATASKLISAAIDTVQRGSAARIAGAMHGTGWAIGGKTGTGGHAGAPMSEQDGWFAGLVFDRQGKARYTVATFVRRGGFGSGHAAEISILLARFLAAGNISEDAQPAKMPPLRVALHDQRRKKAPGMEMDSIPGAFNL